MIKTNGVEKNKSAE